MKVYIHLSGHSQELDLSIDRLSYGEPTKDEWKSVVLELVGPFKENQGLLDLASYFELSLVSGGHEVGKMRGATIVGSIVIDSLETICLQVSGKLKLINFLDLWTPK